MIIPYQGITPKIHPSCFIAPNATIIGDVEIGENSVVLFGAVVRGDIHKIKIGKNSNIQDNVVIHTSRNLSTTTIGDNVSVGHSAILHGCSIGNNVIVGMGCTILDLVEILETTIIGANTFITMRKKFFKNKIIMGFPATGIRDLIPNEIKSITELSETYVKTGQEYKQYFENQNK